MSDNECEAYRNAGDLWGRVSKELGFGNVVLMKDAINTECFLLQWRCTIKGQVYGASWIVSPEELSRVMAIDFLTERIVSNWKRGAQKAFDGKLPKPLGS